MVAKIDMTGKKIGHWTIISPAPKRVGSTKAFWFCKCACGNISVVNGVSLRNSKSTRCKNCANLVHGNSKHGLVTPEFRTWYGMIKRCEKPTAKDYCVKRGITVCGRWREQNGFINFLSDMGSRPSSRHSIDRINNDGNYEPTNCRWATREIQDKNRSNVELVLINNNSYSVAEACRDFSVNENKIYCMVRGGHSKQAAFDYLLGLANGK